MSNFEDTMLINTKLYSAGIFAVLSESIKPVIKNIYPSINSTYNSNDVKEITFNLFDEHSGINYNSIYIKIDNEQLFYDYIKYRKLIRCNINKPLYPGKHSIEIYAEDNLGNSIYKNGFFHIK